MPPAPSQPVTLSERPVALRMRPDLVVFPQRFGGRAFWGVKDPLSLRFFQLQEEEYAILKMLDGRTSLEEIGRRFERMFAPLQMNLRRLQAFLARLHRDGLVVADAPGQGEQLHGRQQRVQRRKLAMAWTRILAIRFRGFDPQAWLDRLYPMFRWLFSPWCVAACLLLVLAAAILVAVQFDVLTARLPAFGAFFNTSNMLWIAVALAAVKILHEFGHALTCKHFGAKCHEMGVMLLVLTPCLYCNVSDSWRLESKWRRIAVAGAGIYVEVVLAAACTFVWFFSEPGLLNTLALNTMFVCSVSTILFNGNPLLRYDGYYILSDLLEVPNLAQRSRAILMHALARWCLGLEVEDERALPERRRGWLAAYAVASIVYRGIVLFAILWLIHAALKPYRFEVLALLLALVAVAGLAMPPIVAALTWLRHPLRRRAIQRGRLAVCGAVLGASAAAICLVPVPFHVTAPVVLEARDAERVYVSVPGSLVETVAAGDVVAAGDTLARLADLDLEMEIAKLAGQRDQQQLRLANLQIRQVQDPTLAADIPTAKEALADVVERLARRRADQKRLHVTAPAGGTVIPPPRATAEAATPGQLAAWHGTPLETRNLGSYLEVGTLLCSIGDPPHLEAILLVDQGEIDFVRSGARVRTLLDQFPGRMLEGTIREVAKVDLKIVPREFSGDDALLQATDQRGVSRPLDTLYRVRVEFDEEQQPHLIGAHGRAKIVADWQPLGRRLYRYLSRTFRFEM